MYFVLHFVLHLYQQKMITTFIDILKIDLTTTSEVQWKQRHKQSGAKSLIGYVVRYGKCLKKNIQ